MHPTLRLTTVCELWEGALSGRLLHDSCRFAVGTRMVECSECATRDGINTAQSLCGLWPTNMCDLVGIGVK